MLFNSKIFLIFIVLFLCLWPFLRKNNTIRWVFLVVASFIFYGWWDVRYLSLIIISGLIDFFAALGIGRFPERKKFFLFLSIAGNLGILISFKYLTFLSDNITVLAGLLGMDISLVQQVPEFMLVLPLGISFYTFQSMSYTIDVYGGQLKPTRNVFHFFAYLSMFPQLVAGPVVRAREMLPQLTRAKPVSEKDFWDGTVLVVHGFFKKVFIADHLAVLVTAAFANQQGEGSGLFWWLIAMAFAVQVYCDFSGYSDIARGIIKWMGYDVAINFNHPYTATSIQEFWDKWHISMTSWFRDYIYYGLVRRDYEKIRVSGIQLSQARMLAYMWITFLAVGIWHGAAWKFILFGAVQACFIHIEIITKWPVHLKKLPVGRWLAWMVTMAQILVSMMIFRAESLPHTWDVFIRMITFHNGLSLGFGPQIGIRDFLILTVLIGIILLRELSIFTGTDQILKKSRSYSWFTGPFVLALLALVTIYFRAISAEFIYFQF
jgi:alginate O-acetyltransferase complex protein AlgI